MGQSSSKKASSNAALLKASMEGDIDEVKRIVGRSISSTTDDQQHDAKDNLRHFVDQADAQGNAAVHGAAFSGNLEILRFLADACGADALSCKNNLGCTPLWLAAGYGHVDVLKYILELIESVSSLSLQPAEIISSPNNNGDTTLLAAASRCHLQVCKLLIEAVEKYDGNAHAFVRKANLTGDSPLSVVVGGSNGSDEAYELLGLLLDLDANVEEGEEERALNKRNEKGLTPLLIACERNNAKIALKLIENGALPLKDSNGSSPLAVAAFCGCDDVVSSLLNIDFGKDLLNTADEAGGCTPLFLAARTGNEKMVRLLLDADADPEITNVDGLTPEAVAVKYQKTKVMEVFGYDVKGIKQ